MAKIVMDVSEENRKANHIPDELWEMSKEHEVYIRDHETGELIGVMDLTDEDTKEGAIELRIRNQEGNSVLERAIETWIRNQKKKLSP